MRGCVINPRRGARGPPSCLDGCAPPGLPLTLLAAWAWPGCGWEGRRWRGAARIRAGWGRVRPSEEGLNICDYRYQGHMQFAFVKHWATRNLRVECTTRKHWATQKPRFKCTIRKH